MKTISYLIMFILLSAILIVHSCTSKNKNEKMQPPKAKLKIGQKIPKADSIAFHSF